MKKRMQRRKHREQRSATTVVRPARQLLADSRFFHRVVTKVGELGIVGEKKNCSIIFLAGLTAKQPEPVSIMLKGSSSSGKSSLVRKVLQLLPPECVQELSSLSKKAPAYGKGSLVGQVLFFAEYRGMKEALYLIRLLQSDGMAGHEATAVRGHRRSTKIAERIGPPVVLTTTTESEVFRDDETRFLSLHSDESKKQTRAILRAMVNEETRNKELPCAVFQEAVRIIRASRFRLKYPPWLANIVQYVPSDDVRIRRDFGRLLSFTKTIAICRLLRDRCSEKEAHEVAFEDYCIAYELLNGAFSSTLRSLPLQALQAARAVRSLWNRKKESVTAQQVAKYLQLKPAVTYKYLHAASRRKLVKRLDAASRPDNLKPFIPGRIGAKFLPSPQRVLDSNLELPSKQPYCHPLTGKTVVLRRRGHGE